MLFLCQPRDLTLFDRLLIGEGERSNEEFGFSYLHPVVQNLYRPDTRPQGQVQRGFVVRELSAGLDEDVVRCGDDVDGIHPDDSDGDVGALPPLLHAHWLVRRPQQPPEIPEQSLLGVPLGANLKPRPQGCRHRLRKHLRPSRQVRAPKAPKAPW